MKKGSAENRTQLSWLLRIPAVVSGLFLVAVMLLTTTDVALRYFLNAPLFGTVEITELMLIGLIMLAMPYCAVTNGHIRVDVLDRLLGRFGRLFADVLSGLLSLTVLGLLVWRTVEKAIESDVFSDATNLLRLPIWPLYGLIAIGMTGYALVVARDLVALLSHRGHGNE